MVEDQVANLNLDEKEKIEGMLSQMKEAIKAKDLSKVDELEAEINNAWQAVSQRIYGQNQQQQAEGGEQPQQPNDFDSASAAQEENVQDAEFEEVK
jgi:molecular chaperone DnaK